MPIAPKDSEPCNFPLGVCLVAASACCSFLGVLVGGRGKLVNYEHSMPRTRGPQQAVQTKKVASPTLRLQELNLFNPTSNVCKYI
jgi:hypothetical protein